MKAVFFDFGGTLYDYATLVPGDRESLTELCRLAGVCDGIERAPEVHREAMKRVFREYLGRPYYRHGDMFRDAVLAMVRELGGSANDEHLASYVRLQRELHRRDFRLREGAIETLEEIRRRGLGLGIVSNIDDDQLAHLAELAGLEPYFDWLLSSETAQSCKPDAAIFAEALRRAGCRADEALFVGDSLSQDIAGANRAGLRSVLLWHREDRDPPRDGIRPRHVIRRLPEVLDLLD
ncbi:MAG: HAD family hydrolase [Candidatus Binatia bacterium]